MIKDLKELKSLLLLCRKQGVTEITLGDCHLKLGPLPDKPIHQHTSIPQADELTEEQLMFYSVEGLQQ